MKIIVTSALSLAVALTTTSLSYAQLATAPGTRGTDPVTQRTGVGPDSRVTGYSESGRGGTGGYGGGPTTNGTSDGSGTATGGPPGGYSDRH